jgi:hypothetical protein
MQFEVERNRRTGELDLAFKLKSGRVFRYYGIRDFHIVEEDGNPLELYTIYTVLGTKVTKVRPPYREERGRSFLWYLEGDRRGYVKSFRNLIDEIAPGCLGKDCYVTKLWIKKDR